MKKLALRLVPKGYLRVIAAVALSVTAIRAGEAEKALSRMRSSWDTVKCYTVTMQIHQVKDNRTKNYTVNFSCNSSGWIKTDVIEGDNKGSVAVYDPVNDRIRIRWAGIALPITLSPESKSTQGLRGEKVYEASFGAMLKQADWYLSHGALSWIGEETFEGTACAVIEFVTDSPDKNHGLARERWWLDKKTGFPRKTEGYEPNGTKGKWLIYTDLRINPELSGDHFNL